jgi:hypothetical protein
MVDGHGVNQQMHVNNVLQVGVVTLFVGPPPPPDMQRSRFLSYMLPQVSVQLVQDKVTDMCFERLISVSKDIWGKAVASGLCATKDGTKTIYWEDDTFSQENVEAMGRPTHLEESVTVATPISKRKKRNIHAVQSQERRFTRSCLKEEGYRPKPILAVQPKIKKIPRAKLLIGPAEDVPMSKKNHKKKPDDDLGEQQFQQDIPITPVHVLQRVGRELGIAAEKLTKDQLEADPGVKKNADVNEDTT